MTIYTALPNTLNPTKIKKIIFFHSFNSLAYQFLGATHINEFEARNLFISSAISKMPL